MAHQAAPGRSADDRFTSLSQRIRTIVLDSGKSYLQRRRSKFTPAKDNLNQLALALADHLQTCLKDKLATDLEETPYKLVLNCTLIEERGQGVVSAGGQLWNTATDHALHVSIRAEGFYCLVAAFLVKFHDLVASANLRQQSSAAGNPQSTEALGHEQGRTSHAQTKDPKETARSRAAITIQAAVRRWLICQRRKALAKTNAKKVAHWSQDRIRKLNADIELWQMKNEVPRMTDEELLESFEKTQAKYAQFIRARAVTSARDNETKALVTQSRAISVLLENPPKLQDYCEDDWATFRSLPLHIAARARLDHKAQMEEALLPRWKRASRAPL